MEALAQKAYKKKSGKEAEINGETCNNSIIQSGTNKRGDLVEKSDKYGGSR